MASVKIKFRPSTVDRGQGTIFYQVIHNRVARQQKTGYRLYAGEWDSHSSEVILPQSDGGRKHYLSEVRERIRSDIRRFDRIIAALERAGAGYTVDGVMAEFTAARSGNSFFTFMEGVIAGLKRTGKARLSETYTLNSFRRFREDKDLEPDEMDSDLMAAYEARLKADGISPNSSSFYMRNLRAVYNRAVEKGLTAIC
ncbi:phage integrase SAM-like domain-containing protein [Bacteroides clarus]|uniref:phage integrase SAM-like domain-containing protein n=1 Tax=Bacteroides clarus TaxID=626929 RepID=UPI003A865B81